jgi:hypothetical protein
LAQPLLLIADEERVFQEIGATSGQKIKEVRDPRFKYDWFGDVRIADGISNSNTAIIATPNGADPVVPGKSSCIKSRSAGSPNTLGCHDSQ